MNPINTRICIYPKDVMVITGWTYKHSLREMTKLRKKLNKERHHLVTIEECCIDRGLRIENIRNMLQ